MSDTALRKLARWASTVHIEDVPERVRAQAVNQILSTLAAVFSGYESDLGPLLEQTFQPVAPGEARVVPSGVRSSATHAAMLMSSWSMILDFDDVMLGGHTCHSSVLVPLAMSNGHSGSELLLAQIVANEIAARINMVCAVGSTRGQMATHLHLIAAAAARAKLEQLDESKFAEALAFALAYPGQALFPAFLGSDAKALCAALPIRNGIEAVDAVIAGLEAPADPLDDRRGFFATAARVPVRDFLEGLGERWHTETTSFKLYPVCGYLCSTIDATLDLVREHEIASDQIESVDVWSSVFTVGMDSHSAPYLDGPRSRIATLTFSTPFTVATAILARDLGAEHLKRTWIENPRVWELAARVRSRHDVDLTLDALRSDIPVGAGLRRIGRMKAAGFGWSLATAALGRSGRWRHPLQMLKLVAGLVAAAGEKRALDFEKSTKAIGSRVEIRMTDGRVLTRTVAIPRAFAGAQS
ncbi:MAG TPA: MmgE/PrpD family protein, partial [Thermoanaerobaculia bacterium]|nr:MmgE/PrpD family protein [Thermoanaerobaculia bacterium]